MDHFKFLQSLLAPLNYEGVFYPKPDSPCLYYPGNNGPDGCALFFKTNKFELQTCGTQILKVWGAETNQVVIAANLRVIETGKEFCVCTTHLKARSGKLLALLRNEQGKVGHIFLDITKMRIFSQANLSQRFIEIVFASNLGFDEIHRKHSWNKANIDGWRF